MDTLLDIRHTLSITSNTSTITSNQRTTLDFPLFSSHKDKGMHRNSNNFFFKRTLVFLCSLFMITSVFAGIPLWTFEPLTATKVTVPANGTAMVQYRVTNQSNRPHTLAMQPINGITQSTTGLNVCGNPFVLTSKNSCILSLQINGSQLNSPIMDGPIVCQQGSTNQCYRPSKANILHITRGPTAGAAITVNPSALNFVQGNSGVVTITNNIGSLEPAENVTATIPGGSSISVQSTSCGAVLAIGASCTITFTAPAAEGPTNIDISGSNTNTANVAVTVTPVPIATLSVNPTTLMFTENLTGNITVTNNAGSPVAANNIAATIPGGSNISVQSSSCGAVLAIGASCTITFTAPAAEGPTNIDISGSNTNTANVAVTVTPVPIATLSVNPTSLIIGENSTGNVTVTNDAGSLVAANNIVATIPGGSNISVQNTSCGAVLAIGASCTITFASGSQEGPTNISIAGDNTNTVNLDVTVIIQAQISITNPVQQNRVITVSGAALLLEVTNNMSSIVNANAITVSNKASCPNLSVDDSDCTSVLPGASCTLELNSSTPYAPCTITISGSNTVNSPQALIAFSHLGGLVFEESGGSGKIVIDEALGFSSSWSTTFDLISGATSFVDGFANTNAIILNATCTNDPTNCAAQRCQDISADWYLPAQDELYAFRDVLCPNHSDPCTFGGFSSAVYWTSSQSSTNATSAWLARIIPSGGGTGNKGLSRLIRCIRAF